MPAAPILTCLEQLVGLAPAPLPCFAFPTDYSDTNWITDSSRAGAAGGAVYVATLAGLNFGAAKSDPATDLYQRLHDARTQAAQYVRTAIQQAPKYGLGHAKYTAGGYLGKAGNGSVYAGGAALTLTTAYRAGGGYLVKGLGMLTTTPATAVPVLLDGTLVATINTNAGSQPVTPFVIPFDGHSHLLTATLPTGVLPLSGQLFCPPCGGNSPFALSVRASLPTLTAAMNNAGFMLAVTEACVGPQADVLCYAATPSVNDELADTLAQAVQGMAGYFYLTGLFHLASRSRYTLLEDKKMSELAAYFKASADQNIAWLAQPNGLARLPNDCYTCAPNPYAPRTVGAHF
ncbi:MAG: hypothetical protein ACRYFZ_09550 [Janthinobacterium lividum]